MPAIRVYEVPQNDEDYEPELPKRYAAERRRVYEFRDGGAGPLGPGWNKLGEKADREFRAHLVGDIRGAMDRWFSALCEWLDRQWATDRRLGKKQKLRVAEPGQRCGSIYATRSATRRCYRPQ